MSTQHNNLVQSISDLTERQKNIQLLGEAVTIWLQQPTILGFGKAVPSQEANDKVMQILVHHFKPLVSQAEFFNVVRAVPELLTQGLMQTREDMKPFFLSSSLLEQVLNEIQVVEPRTLTLSAYYQKCDEYLETSLKDQTIPDEVLDVTTNRSKETCLDLVSSWFFIVTGKKDADLRVELMDFILQHLEKEAPDLREVLLFSLLKQNSGSRPDRFAMAENVKEFFTTHPFLTNLQTSLETSFPTLPPIMSIIE